MAQYYKGDATEIKFFDSLNPTAGLLSANLDEFEANAFTCFVLGELIFDNKIGPLTNAIPRSIYRECFQQLFDSFVVGGTFESYIEVFKRIFGDDVVIDFTVPDPGKLIIDIEATGIVLSPWVAKLIVDDAFVYDNIVDDEADNIVFQSIKGFETQSEVETMLFQMVSAGIYTEITLTVG
jgi:hypothetical protein